MAVFYGIMILCLFGSSLGQYSSHKPCPKVQSVSSFDVKKFVKEPWFEYQRYFHNFEWHSSCNKINYTFGDNSLLRVVNSFTNDLNKKPEFVDADIYAPNRSCPQEMTVHMPLTPKGAISNYWIVGIDYNKYVNIWGCTNWPAQNLSLTYAWALTKCRNPDASVVAAIDKVWDKLNIDKSNFYKVDQSECDEE